MYGVKWSRSRTLLLRLTDILAARGRCDLSCGLTGGVLNHSGLTIGLALTTSAVASGSCAPASSYGSSLLGARVHNSMAALFDSIILDGLSVSLLRKPAAFGLSFELVVDS